MRLSLLYSTVLIWAAGCTQATTQFSVLDQNAIPQPLFSGQSILNLTTNQDDLTFAIQGQCDPRITQITAQPIGVAVSDNALASYAASPPSVTCATNGQFSFTLKTLRQLGYVAVEAKTYEVQLRGLTSGGLSNASSIFIKFVTPNGNAPRRMVITSGSTESPSDQRHAIGPEPQSSTARIASSTNFQARIRVDHALLVDSTGTAPNAPVNASSTNFRARVGAAASAN